MTANDKKIISVAIIVKRSWSYQSEYGFKKVISYRVEVILIVDSKYMPVTAD
jgi:hypothetical protein